MTHVDRPKSSNSSAMVVRATETMVVSRNDKKSPVKIEVRSTINRQPSTCMVWGGLGGRSVAWVGDAVVVSFAVLMVMILTIRTGLQQGL